MKQTVYLSDLRKAFHDMGRGDQFSYNGLEVLFDGLESLERDTGEEMELDVIALCCDYEEMTPEEVASAYDPELLEGVDEDDHLQAAMDFLCDQTYVLGETANGSIVFAQF